MCRETRHMGTWSIYSFHKNNQHSNYQKINPLDTLKQGAWVPPKHLLFPENINRLIIG